MRQVKASWDRCAQCEYSMRMSAATNRDKKSNNITTVACNYLDITGRSRVFENGDYKENYKPGYCDCYVKRKEKKNA